MSDPAIALDKIMLTSLLRSSPKDPHHEIQSNAVSIVKLNRTILWGRHLLRISSCCSPRLVLYSMACQLIAELAQIGAICEAPDQRKNFAFFSGDVQLHFGFQRLEIFLELLAVLSLHLVQQVFDQFVLLPGVPDKFV